MQKLFNRILSFMMAIIMTLSITTPVFAEDPSTLPENTSQAEPADRSSEETLPADEAGQTEEAVPGEETPTEPDSETVPESNSESTPIEEPSPQPETPAETPGETPAEPQNAGTGGEVSTDSQPDPVPVDETEIIAPTKEFPRLTALYEGHRVRYYDSPKQPLPEHASLHMG